MQIKQDKRKKKSVMSKTCPVHNVFIHFPKDKECDICRDNKPRKDRCDSQGNKACDSLPIPKKFGDSGTLDHKIMNEDDASREGDKNACIILDRATYWLQAYADKTKSADATIRALQKFYGPKIKKTCMHL